MHQTAIEMAHALICGYAHTRLSVGQAARIGTYSWDRLTKLADGGVLPALPRVAAIVGSLGVSATVVIRGPHDPALPTLVVTSSHVSTIDNASTENMVRRLSQLDPAVGHLVRSAPRGHSTRVPAWLVPTRHQVEQAVEQTISRYRAALSQALLHGLATKQWSLRHLAEQCPGSIGTFFSSLAKENGPSLKIFSHMMRALDLQAQICFRPMDEPRPETCITATREELDVLREHVGSSLRVLTERVSDLQVRPAWPSDRTIRQMANRQLPVPQQAQQLHVSRSWLQQQRRRLGLVGQARTRLTPEQAVARDARLMAALHAGGALAAVGDTFGLTRARVQQIAAAHGYSKQQMREQAMQRLRDLVPRVWQDHQDVTRTAAALASEVDLPLPVITRLVKKMTAPMRRQHRIAVWQASRAQDARRRADIGRACRLALRARQGTYLSLAKDVGLSFALTRAILTGHSGSDAAVRMVTDHLGIPLEPGPDGRPGIAASVHAR